MSFGTILYTFFLMPIQLVFETIYSFAYVLTYENPGISIIALSLAMNLLVLPLYRRADMMQEEERNIEARLHDGVAHIKKTFRGDERTMILQTYYRQNNYSPLYVLRSAVSLFLEIPFFIAAYRFLSELSLLHGVSFGPIADLGKPDGLIVLGGFSINLLPIIMTAINVVSTAIFTKGYPLKTKIQLYGMAAFFLVFLYDSPSGLVFYWTLNNLFSLVKTIFYKLKNPKRVLAWMLLVIGVCLMILSWVDFSVNQIPITAISLLSLGFLLTIPFFVGLILKKVDRKPREFKGTPNRKLFFCGTVFLTVLVGILIPSSVLTSSPQEFLIVGDSFHPVLYVVSAFLTAAGMFILWMGVFYWLFSPKAKVIFERVIIIACVAGTVNYLFFANNLGTLSTELEYDSGMYFTVWQIILNLLVTAAVSAAVLFIVIKKPKIIGGVVAAATVAILCMSGINIAGVYSSLSQVDMKTIASADYTPTLTLSKSGKNVIVLMLDRAMGEYIPYIWDEYPDLEKQFSGFTYYSNTVSFGGYTNFGTPALFGGYEYTPEEINKRDDESLQSKHDESLRVMPVLFDDNGYKTTVCDPPYAGYKHIPDLSIYDDHPDINAYITQGTVMSEERKPLIVPSRCRNFFCYSFMKLMPSCAQLALYDYGRYNQLNRVFTTFEKAYDVLKNISSITEVEDGSQNCFIMMNNESTHNLALFEDSDSDYLEIAGRNANVSHKSSLTHNGIKLDLSQDYQIGHYHTNVATYKRLGEWFDYLREQGVYDNTRIILVADHGRPTQQIDNFMIDDTAYDENVEVRYGDVEFFYPLLMVKDFNSTGFTTSDEFMTNADVPTIATDGVIDSPKNPFSGKALDSSQKNADKLYIQASDKWDVATNNGNTFLPSRWYSVHDSIWEKKNWELVSENSTLPE